jgi:GST-like protein
MIDLYTFGTPNGYKVSIMLEELGLPYTVHTINITKNEQFGEAFLKISPNNKIPAIVDRDNDTSIFESVAILMYLAEKTGKFLPKELSAKYNVIQWCLFQAASVGPMFGQFGHFKVYAKETVPYAIERYGTESKRILGVMEKQLAKNAYLAGKEYTIADNASRPWQGS